jgi:hypothetical protein
MFTKRKVIALIAVLVLVSGFVGMAIVMPDSKEDKLIEYLDANNVHYKSRSDMFRLANIVCDLANRGVNTTEYLETAFTKRDAFSIQNGVLNSGYCEDK